MSFVPLTPETRPNFTEWVKQLPSTFVHSIGETVVAFAHGPMPDKAPDHMSEHYTPPHQTTDQ